MAEIDKLTVEISGKTYPMKIGTLGMARALDQGVDVLSEFDSFGKAQGAGGNVTKLLVAVSKIVWAGLLTYDPNVKLDWVMDQLDVPELTKMAPIIGDQMNRFMRGASEGEVQAPKRGKAKS
jgi:hypothetical protein